MAEERLQKILSQAGVASRRHAEQMIREGRVAVNGAAITELGSKADLERDHIKVDGRLIRPPKRLVYLALHKPNNTVTTASDPQGRVTVMDLLRGVKDRVYPVGRLDYHSEGLLLLTNDGELANGIMSAASHLAKTYVVKVEGDTHRRRGGAVSPRRSAFRPAHHAGRTEAAAPRPKILGTKCACTRAAINKFASCSSTSVTWWKSSSGCGSGPSSLGSLKPGEFRHLESDEVRKLERALAAKKAPAKKTPANEAK